MNPDDWKNPLDIMHCAWDTPEYWEAQRRRSKLREFRRAFASRRPARNRKNKLARASRRRNAR